MTYQNEFDRAAIRVIEQANIRAADALRLIGQELRPDEKRAQLYRRTNVAQAIYELSHGMKLTGANRESHDELSRTQLTLHSNSFLHPIEALGVRAVTASNSTALVPSYVLPAADALRAAMVTGALGATIIPLPANAAGNFSLPAQTGTAIATWLSTEMTQVIESDQTFASVQFSPHTASAYTEISRTLNLQAPAVQAVIERDLLSTVGRLTDSAAIYGSGTAGQPTGLTNYTGVGSFNASSLTISTLINAQTALGNGLTQSAGVAATLANAGVMRERQEFTGGSDTIWRGSLLAGTCAGLPARSTTALTANTMILGSWEFLNIPIWGSLEISVNPYAGFQAGVIGFRVFLTLDSAPTYAAAFSIGSNFS
jgi:HK97 family phage major capsid protein